MYRKNRGSSSLCSHSTHTSVPADYSPKIYSTKYASDLISLLEMRICALINSRAARNVFAATVNGTRNRKGKLTVLPNFLETTRRKLNVATEGDIAKTASSRPSHGIFA